ncbi:nucleotide exchange factor GrpE [Nocardioides gilvus]|uniref:nucleotide exchange factor GrpE n=1 Tax=Nocardioides gilvus TaxID=1735589 RepID=UPI001EF6E8BE|nr:nucleotide exchange factor GrpE [Nocardioides gilvus]
MTESPESREPGAEQSDVDLPPEFEIPEVEVPETPSTANPAVEGAGGPGHKDAEGVDPLSIAMAEAAERTSDLQRLQAEFLNYKRRVDRDRELIAQNATIKALSPIIEVLDAIDLARQAGDVDGGFKSVAEKLERAVNASGLARYGEVGDAFDPNLHEALTHMGEDPEVTVTTVKVVARAGYRVGERIVRAAQVLVVDPAAGE